MAKAQHIIQQLVPGLEEASEKEQFLKSIVTEFPFFAAAQLGYVQELINGNASTALEKQKASLVWPPLLLEQLILEKTPVAHQEIQTNILSENRESEDVTYNEVSSEQFYTVVQSDNFKIEEEAEGFNSDIQIIEENINHSSEVKDETFGSVMDLASELETTDAIAKQENTSTIWDEREKLETSLGTEMNLVANNEEDTGYVEQSQNTNKLSSEIFTARRFEESMIKPQTLQDIFATHNAEEKQSEQVEAQKESEAATEEPLIFEPLYTSDYFASQGIKLTEEQMPSDKLGKQLKSFTEWLQTMKSVHPVKIDSKTSHNQEVTTLAEKSNEEEDIITESMAFAYIAQGKPQKAADIYEKLKLLYPHKSAYFAAELLKLQ